MLSRLLTKFTTKTVMIVGTSAALLAAGAVSFVGKTVTAIAPRQATTVLNLQTTSRTIKFNRATALATNSSEQSAARPLTLATADFDEDGTPDLLSGSVNGGVGFLSFYRGNAEAVYATERRAEPALPFFPASHFVNLPTTPDFLVTGDFNADGHGDVVTTARNSTALHLLAGDGKGGWAEAVALELSGEVTALAAGEINCVDGLADLAVAINSPAGTSVLVLSAAEGAWAATPQSFALAHTATSLEFAHLTRDGLSDLAIAAGNELVVLEGGQQTPRLTRTALSFVADSLAVGRFSDSAQEQLALLARDGSLAVVSYVREAERRATNRSRINSGWHVASYLSEFSTQRENTTSRQLLRARVSTSKHDDLLLLQSNQLQFVTNQEAPQRAAMTLEGEADLVAALPMRTNASALQGLVLLSRTQAFPLVIQPEVAMTFVVNSIGDGRDSNPGDGVCASGTAGPPACTLRAAIEEANANVGADTINFNIGAGTQTILLNSSLPPITETVTIDATPLAPAPASQAIVISPGPNFSDFNFALTITSSDNTIRGLTITGFGTTGALRVNSGTGNVIEGNILRNNFGSGLQINSSNNLIGGTTAAARNLIAANSASGLGINSASGNRIVGNYIGTDSTGTNDDGNNNGIALFFASNNTIGGTAAGARNVIAGNRFAGILVSGGASTASADGNTIQGNYIGVDATGIGALGNAVASGAAPDSGIRLIDTNLTTIGGTAPTAGNVIANNGASGVTLPTPSGTPGITANRNQVLNNSIYNNGGLGIDLGATGVTANDPGDGDGGANNLQNYPILTSALTRTTGTTITGTLNSTASSTFTIELFNNPTCDASGNGEGQTFLARTTVTTNAAGLANFSVVTTPPILAGRFITATATDASGNTSEFSACRAVQNAVVDLSVAQTVAPNPVFVGNNLTYNLTVTNSGPDDATGVLLANAITIPNGQFTVVSTTPSQGTCTGTGPINCNLGTIVATANATVRIVIAPTIPTTPPISGAPPQSVLATNTATASSNELDSLPPNNTNATSATVNASADLAIGQTVTPNPAASGSIVTYTIAITNNGPSTASNVSARFDPSLLLTNVTCTAPAGSSCNRDGNPFFTFTPNLAPGTAVFTVRGTLICLGQNATLTNAVNVSSSTFDVNAANNTSTLNTTGQAGAAIGTIAYDVASTTALALGPVVAGSSGTPPSGTFTLTNTGCLPMNLTTAQFIRASNTANLSGVDDSRYYTLRLIPPTGAEIPLNPTPTSDRNAPQPIPIVRTLQSGQSLRFRVTFSPPLPFFAGAFASRDQGLFANQVLPDLFDSRIVFNFITGGQTSSFSEAVGDPGSVAANMIARVAPAIQIIPRDGNLIGNPATTPLVIMETLRGDFRVRVSLFDANKNATRITYQFFDTFRQPASNPIEVNLTSALSASALLPGQAFTLQQDFSGAAARPDIVYVRVVVTDGDATTVSASSNPLIPALAAPASFISSEAVNSDVLKLPVLRLDGSAGHQQRQTDSRSETKANREN